jgi:hypothetical protein
LFFLFLRSFLLRKRKKLVQKASQRIITTEENTVKFTRPICEAIGGLLSKIPHSPLVYLIKIPYLKEKVRGGDQFPHPHSPLTS